MLGPNGAGKTTLLRCILGLYPVTSGTVELENGVTIGYLPQKFGLFRELKVIDMMDYFAVAKKVPKGKRTDEIMRVLDLVHLSDRAQDKAGQLSGGMQRRLASRRQFWGIRMSFCLMSRQRDWIQRNERGLKKLFAS